MTVLLALLALIHSSDRGLHSFRAGHLRRKRVTKLSLRSLVSGIFSRFTATSVAMCLRSMWLYLFPILAMYCTWWTPVRAREVKSRMCPPYPQRDRKRRLHGAVCRNHRIKRVVPCRCLDGHVKEPYEMTMAWEPDRRSNFFSPPAHLCAVTYMTLSWVEFVV